MTTRISALSSIIAEKTKVVDDYFSRNGLPTPSFDVTGPRRIQIPPSEQEASGALNDVLDATKELNLLLTGPAGVIINTSPMDCVSLHAVYHFRIAQALPIDETVSFEDLSAKVGLNFIDLRRLLRHAMCNGIFREPKPGYVAHTATSKLLADDKVLFDFAGLATEESLAPASKIVDALVKYKGAHAPEQTGYSLAQETNMGLYDYMQAHYDTRGKRWAGAMNAFAASLSLEPLLRGYDWASDGKPTMVVDVGGGWGPVSIGIAERFPKRNFVVQDLPGVVEEGSSKLPEHLQDRIRFMPYDFVRETQPVEGAEIYFFRAVFHNWPDEYCIIILRNQIPALKPGARLVMYDTGIAELGELPATKNKQARDMDLKMLMWFGSRERNMADWKQILADADPRFHLVTSPTPTGDIFVIEWEG